jgi:hypothetical protein
VTVSVVCGVKDRAEHLALSLPTWLVCPEVSEVVVVDWSSKEPLSLPPDPRILHVRVEGQRYWHASRCHNLGVRLATSESVLRLDADVLMLQAFFRLHPRQPGHFWHVDYGDVRAGDEIHLAGVVYASRADVLAAGGYNERLRVYGVEDDDLVARLSRRCRPLAVDVRQLHHIPHGDDLRVVNQPISEYRDLVVRPPCASWTWNLSVPQRAVAMNQALAADDPWDPGRDQPAFFEVVRGEGYCGTWWAREVAVPSSLQRRVARENQVPWRPGLDVASRGVSVICGCRDRSESFQEVVPSWLPDPRVRELVVVDWGSSPGEAGRIAAALSRVQRAPRSGPPARVVLVRVEGEETWQPGPCFNLALSHASHEEVLKLDADVLAHVAERRMDFLDEHRLAGGDFFAGDWRLARSENERHLSGVVYARRSDLLAANGWSERVVTYGYDDEDLYARLAARGLRLRKVNLSSLYHIPHSDTIRLQSQPGRVSSCLTETEFNRQMTQTKPWLPSDAIIGWELLDSRSDDGLLTITCRRAR